ncbi:MULTISPECIES: DUF4240 domain-containing protein [unclassified Bacillus (in: firmicutes)]|uniref:DUF4240 domain-containing protein n=1 Tax=unclassified Bacillus (in: firmicutes) TaxID=185979 RepID=UPI001124C617|nr:MULTISPECIES: DUF4240 domain-containing protein [unclassified Bacillus (in: firmicutes)]
MDKQKFEVLIGDVFAVKLPDGRFGAIRIAKHHQELGSYLVITTPYIGEELPVIENNCLTYILRQNHFFYKNNRALVWVDGEPPRDLIYIGNLPLAEKEKAIICNSFCEQWDRIGIEVYHEWRWENDQENFIKEVQEEQKNDEEENRNIAQVPKKMMHDEEFWSIISLLNSNGNGREDILEPAVIALSKMSVKDIKEFEEALSYKLYLLDTREHAKNIGEYSYIEDNPINFSVDLFLYIRCAVVAEGQQNFERTLKNPEMMNKNRTFEPLLSIASYAYATRMKKDFEYTSGCSYETFSNIAGWKG